MDAALSRSIIFVSAQNTSMKYTSLMLAQSESNPRYLIKEAKTFRSRVISNMFAIGFPRPSTMNNRTPTQRLIGLKDVCCTTHCPTMRDHREHARCIVCQVQIQRWLDVSDTLFLGFGQFGCRRNRHVQEPKAVVAT
jgi:hypothetical protein